MNALEVQKIETQRAMQTFFVAAATTAYAIKAVAEEILKRLKAGKFDSTISKMN